MRKELFSMKDNDIYLFHIIDAINKIEQYLNGVKEEIFFDNEMLQDAWIRQLTIIGEATKNLPTIIRNKHIHIPWKQITGMRDKLTHDYLGVDLIAVWETLIRNTQIKKS